MKRHASRYAALLIAIMLAVSLLSGCGSKSGSSTSPGATAEPSSGVPSSSAPEVAKVSPVYTVDDLETEWKSASAVQISLSGSSISVSGSGATTKGSTLTITKAGTYVLSGTLTDGQIIIDAAKNDTVRLVLNGVRMACSNSAPIYAKQAGKTILTLAAGTDNVITDGSSYVYADAVKEEPDAAIFCKDPLTINGTGSLTVNGQFHNGIGTKDDLVITGGQITVKAVNDGLQGRDSVAIKAGSFSIDAGADGIQSNNDEDAAKGWIALDGGSFKVIARMDAIQAETVLQITDGVFDLVTGGGSVNSSTDAAGEFRPRWGDWRVAPNLTPNAETTSDSGTSAKGLKAGRAVIISGGTFTLDTSDDAVHANESVTIAGGTLTISSGDDGLHADSNLTLDNGTINISKSYEGLEAAAITINGGSISVVAADDGLNAAGGNDGSAMQGRPGQNRFSANTPYFIRITGGSLDINANGDGIDANGAIYIDGGTVLVNGPTNSGNGALDYDGICEITGGLLIAAGSAGMAQAPGGASTQNSLMVVYSSVQKAGTMINLAAEDGSSVVTFVPSKDYQTVVISAPELAQGKNYTLSSGGSSTGQAVNGLYNGGSYSPGTNLATITLTGVTTIVTDSGVPTSGGMVPGGGGMRPGGGGGGTPPGGTRGTNPRGF